MLPAAAGALLVAVCAILPAHAAEIEPYGRGALAAIKQAHADRPLVVHFWSITCIPCLTEMPRLAGVTRERSDFDLVLVAADPIERRDRISARLEEFGFKATTSYAYADAFEERLRYEADRAWRGELPFTLMIDPSGSSTAVVGELDRSTLTSWLATVKP